MRPSCRSRSRRCRPQTPERWIKTVHLIVDENPAPVAGVFHFFPESGTPRSPPASESTSTPTCMPWPRPPTASSTWSSGSSRPPAAARHPGMEDKAAVMARLGKMQLKPMTTFAPGRGQRGPAADQPSQLYRDADGPADPLLDPAGLCPDRQGQLRRRRRCSRSRATSHCRRTRRSPSRSCRTRPGAMAVQVEDTEGRKFEQTWPVGPTS